MTPVLSLNNVAKSYGPVKALKGVSFDVPPGSVFGILGPNGSGKTTLLSIVLDVLKADTGDFTWFGESYSHEQRERGEGRVEYSKWNVESGEYERGVFESADVIIHLAGANVAEERWTEKRKREILESRVKSGALIVKALKEVPNKISVVISASAIGWYGGDTGRPFVETDLPANDFLGQTCFKWESSIKEVEALGKRLFITRTGIVLAKEGGAYAEFIKPMKAGLATILGSGKQVVSWIHIQDLVQLYAEAVTDERYSGVYNAVAPNPATNADIIKAIAKERGGVALTTKVPSFVLKAMLGEMSVEILKSARVSSEKLLSAGFNFKFPTIEEAVKGLEGS